MERYFWHLNARQSDGMACVVCNTDFLNNKITSVPVGRSPADESQVFACKDPCAAVIADEAARMAKEMRAAVGADEADDEADGGGLADGEDPVFCVDGHFGSLLRDLRALAGAEALLATSDDIPTLRFLLGLTARHAETAMMRARLVLARTKEGDG
ncbi:hypothetical protein [Streptomyces sp. MMG1121]|uniref:hypothetical protein n=1 Tax=Streptomyces sp. MMG1121 TaxID=1415544 RepID=UPI0006AF7E84|nr:hypothetical protein [Streptomyces sp. MMG1121]KOV63254.1 hypothetical protein ADK64_21075 [Streptomyces sp. MMG1121]